MLNKKKSYIFVQKNDILVRLLGLFQALFLLLCTIITVVLYEIVGLNFRFHLSAISLDVKFVVFWFENG